VQGDSRWAVARRVLAALIALGLIPALPILDVHIALQGAAPFISFTMPAGLLVSGVALLFWAALTGVLAWIQTSGPNLRFAQLLEPDQAARVFRWRIWNDSAVRCRPRVVLTRVWTLDNKDLLDPAQSPLELQWTHQPAGVRCELGKQDYRGETVGVVRVDLQPPVAGAPEQLIAFGAFHQPALGEVSALSGAKIFMAVSTTLPELPSRRQMTSILEIEGENSEPLGFRSVPFP